MTHQKRRLVQLILALGLIMMLTVTFPSKSTMKVAAVSPGAIIWTQTSNPSNGYEIAYGVAVDSSGVYIVGWDYSPGPTDYEWRIEKRSLTTGALITGFGTGGVVQENPTTGNQGDAAHGVAVDGSGLYIVGWDAAPGSYVEWRIEKRDLSTGALISTFGTNGIIQEDATGYSEAYRVAVDGSGLYIVGFDSSPGNYEWRIEKRNLSTGALIWAQTSNPSSGSDNAVGVAVDGSGLYIVGFDNSPGELDPEWRIEKRSLTTGALITGFGTGGVIQENPTKSLDQASDVAVDGSGLYIVGFDNAPGNGEWRIEKRDLTTGSLIGAFGPGGIIQENPSSGNDWATSASVDGSGLYVAGVDASPGNLEWRIEKRSLTDGSTMWTQTENPSTGNDGATGVAHGSGLYVVGYDYSPGTSDSQWRIESRDPGIPAPIPEYPLGLALLAVFMTVAYGLIRRRNGNPRNI